MQSAHAGDEEHRGESGGVDERRADVGILGLVALLTALAVLWALPAAGVNILKPYQAKRLTGFTHPDVDPQGDTYNLRQSITAVGAGGLRGRGVQGATQTRLNYLPEHATDFAFASLCGGARLLRRLDPHAPSTCSSSGAR